MRAAEIAAEAAERSRDTRDQIQAEILKRQAAAELQRQAGPAMLPRSRGKAWRW
jgi:hypothetical protein